MTVPTNSVHNASSHTQQRYFYVPSSICDGTFFPDLEAWLEDPRGGRRAPRAQSKSPVTAVLKSSGDGRKSTEKRVSSGRCQQLPEASEDIDDCRRSGSGCGGWRLVFHKRVLRVRTDSLERIRSIFGGGQDQGDAHAFQLAAKGHAA